VIVVDASVALAWALPDTAVNHRYVQGIWEAGVSGRESLIAPLLMRTECAYVILKKSRALRWGDAKAAEYAEFIDTVPIHYMNANASIATHVRFAVRHHTQGFDAVYLGLALATGAKIATLDKGLLAAAKRAGVLFASE
jgi:predicted nucleic acid-binding protein